ncbi:hypothetical protein GCM10010424_45040 [Streptomyces lienomycini]
MHLVGRQVDVFAVEDLGHHAPLSGHAPTATAQPFQKVTHTGQPNSKGDQIPNRCDFGALLDLDIVYCRIENGFSQGTGLQDWVQEAARDAGTAHYGDRCSRSRQPEQ